MSVTEITRAVRQASYEQVAVWCALAAVLLAMLTGAAAIVATLAPMVAAAPIFQPLRPDYTVGGTLSTSDGRTFAGALSTAGGKPLRIFERGSGRTIDIGLKEIARIDVAVEEERAEPYWYWKESGEKVYPGTSYPWRKYITTVTLLGGRSIAGDLDGLIYVEVPSPVPQPVLDSSSAPQETGPRKYRFLFQTRATGVEEQTVADLVYITSLTVAGESKKGH